MILDRAAIAAIAQRGRKRLTNRQLEALCTAALELNLLRTEQYNKAQADRVKTCALGSHRIDSAA